MNQYDPYQGTPKNGYAPHSPNENKPQEAQYDDFKDSAASSQTVGALSDSASQNSLPVSADPPPSQPHAQDLPPEVRQADDSAFFSPFETIEELSASILTNPSILIQQAIYRKKNSVQENKDAFFTSHHASPPQKDAQLLSNAEISAASANMRASDTVAPDIKPPSEHLQNAVKINDPPDKDTDETTDNLPHDPLRNPESATDSVRTDATKKRAPLPTGPLQGFTWANGKTDSDIAGMEEAFPADLSPHLARAGRQSAMSALKTGKSANAGSPQRSDPKNQNPSDHSTSEAQPFPSRADSNPVQHSFTVDTDGPVLHDDGILHEKLAAFVHSQGIRRVVHTKGYGAFGVFYPYQSMSEYTCADFLQSPDKFTPVLTRFSFAVSNQGTPDTSRNVRGFSVKFYTDEGIFDLLCNHIPVFFIRDAMEFPETIAALSPSPKNNLPDPARLWSFIADHPQTMNMLTYLYSDQGTAASFRHIPGHSVSTFVWKNAQGKRHYVKYTWLPLAGIQYVNAKTAEILSGQQPDVAGKDLYDTLKNGTPVEYELYVQLIPVEKEYDLGFDPLDDTKVWSEREFPLQKVGKLSLIKNPEDYKAQVESVAFSPNNLVRGIELSDDKLLQGRSTIYWDAQRFRLGDDFRELPVNRYSGWSPNRSIVTSGMDTEACGLRVRAEIEKPDDFSQPRERYENMSPEQKNRLTENIASDLKKVPANLQARVLSLFRQVSPDYAAQVKIKLGS